MEMDSEIRVQVQSWKQWSYSTGSKKKRSKNFLSVGLYQFVIVSVTTSNKSRQHGLTCLYFPFFSLQRWFLLVPVSTRWRYRVILCRHTFSIHRQCAVVATLGLVRVTTTRDSSEPILVSRQGKSHFPRTPIFLLASP